jgi:hypothetical protein
MSAYPNEISLVTLSGDVDSFAGALCDHCVVASFEILDSISRAILQWSVRKLKLNTVNYMKVCQPLECNSSGYRWRILFGLKLAR